jgi:hypothetical protein
MAEQLRLAFNDYDGDTQTTSFLVNELNDPALDYPAFNTDVGALATQLDLFSAGYNRRQEYVIQVVENVPGSANTPIAQSSTQAIFEVKDTVTETIYKERLPFPDLAMADDGSSNPAWISVGQGSGSLTVFNTDHANWATLKAAYDAVGVTPNGNTAELVRVYIEE